MIHNTKNFRSMTMNKMPVMMNEKNTVSYYNFWSDLHDSMSNALKEVRDCKILYEEFVGIPCSLDEFDMAYPDMKEVVGDLEEFFDEVKGNKVLFFTLRDPIAIEYSDERIYLIASNY